MQRLCLQPPRASCSKPAGALAMSALGFPIRSLAHCSRTSRNAICQIEAFASGPVNRSSDRNVCEALHRGVTFENGVSVWVRKEANPNGISLTPRQSRACFRPFDSSRARADGDFTTRLMKRLGLSVETAGVRASLAHCNTPAEIHRSSDLLLRPRHSRR